MDERVSTIRITHASVILLPLVIVWHSCFGQPPLGQAEGDGKSRPAATYKIEDHDLPKDWQASWGTIRSIKLKVFVSDQLLRARSEDENEAQDAIAALIDVGNEQLCFDLVTTEGSVGFYASEQLRRRTDKTIRLEDIAKLLPYIDRCYGYGIRGPMGFNNDQLAACSALQGVVEKCLVRNKRLSPDEYIRNPGYEEWRSKIIVLSTKDLEIP